MAQIVTNYDLSGGNTEVAAATSANNVRFQYAVTGSTDATQEVRLRVQCSEDDITYFDVLDENKEPFEWVIQGDKTDSKHILVIGSAYVQLKVLCNGTCDGLLNVFTYES